jgi:hypothetical protein
MSAYSTRGGKRLMQSKKILTAALLVFVAFSLVELVLKRVREAEATANPAEQAAPVGGPASGKTPAAKPGVPKADETVIVYYCHTRERCTNCRNYEALAQQLIESEFGRYVEEGRLAWQAVNFDEPMDRHFDTDYKLGGVPTLVLVRVRDGSEIDSRKLPRGLMLMAMGERDKLTRYVRGHVQAFLDKQPAPEDEE